MFLSVKNTFTNISTYMMMRESAQIYCIPH